MWIFQHCQDGVRTRHLSLIWNNKFTILIKLDGIFLSTDKSCNSKNTNTDISPAAANTPFHRERRNHQRCTSPLEGAGRGSYQISGVRIDGCWQAGRGDEVDVHKEDIVCDPRGNGHQGPNRTLRTKHPGGGRITDFFCFLTRKRELFWKLTGISNVNNAR